MKNILNFLKSQKNEEKTAVPLPQEAVLETQESGWCRKVSKLFLMIFVVAMPLVFLNIAGVNNIDFNKQAFVIFVISLISLLFYWGEISKGESVFHFSSLHILAAVFLGLSILSTIFSRWAWGSFWGWPLVNSRALVTLIFFFFFFALFSFLYKKKELFSLSFIFSLIAFALSVLGLLQVFNIFILPWEFTRTLSFTPVGSLSSLAIFLGAFLPVNIALVFIVKKPSLKALLLFSFLTIFALLLAINHSVAWWEIVIGSFLFLIFGFWRFKSGRQLLWLPIVLLGTSLLLTLFNIDLPGLPDLPLNISPSFASSIDITVKMLSNSIGESVFGWGPGTFKFGWARFKDPSLNQTIFWNLDFASSKAHLLDIMGENGLLAGIVFILMIVFAVAASLKILFAWQGREEENFLLLGFLGSFLAISFAALLSSFNLFVYFWWWFVLAAIAIFISVKRKKINLLNNSQFGFFFSLFGVLLFIAVVSSVYLETARYVAEIRHISALKQTSFEDTTALLLSARKLNPNQDAFYRDLANTYLVEATQRAINVNLGDDAKAQEVRLLIANAVATGQKATEVSPYEVDNWQTRAAIYRELIGISQGAFNWAVKSYEETLKLEPANPALYVGLGRSYLSQAVSSENSSAEYMEKAEESFRKAIELKPDYAQAFYQLSLVYELSGRRQEAITTLESVKTSSPFTAGYNPLNDVGLAFQLGVLYYRDGQYSRAQNEFERALFIRDDYANARYFLGLIYDKNGQRERAISQFEVVLRNNPQNEEVGQILQNLKSGLPALSGIVSEEQQLPEELPLENEGMIP